MSGDASLVHYADEQGFTALLFAFEKGRDDHTKVLLRRGADMSIKTKTGNGALHFASKVGKVSSSVLKEQCLDLPGVLGPTGGSAASAGPGPGHRST